MENTVVYIALGIFGIVVLLMAVYGYVISAKTSEDYMLAGRGIGIIVMFFFMLFAISSAWTFYGYSGFLYQHGPSYVYFVWGCVAGFASLYMFLGPRLWAVTRLNRFLSPVEMMSARYESKALRLILVILLLAFIVPYMFVYGPSLLLIGAPGRVLLTVATASIGVVLISAGMVGFFFKRAYLWERGCLLMAAILLIKPGLYTDGIGALLLTTVILSQKLRKTAPVAA